MKKVRLLTHTLSDGGAERAVSNISLNLNDNIDREITLYGESAKVTYPYKGKLSFIDRRSDSTTFKLIRNIIQRVKELKKVKESNESIPTISFLLYPNLINTLTASSGPTIISIRNHMSTMLESMKTSIIWRIIIKRIYSKANVITVVSKEIKKDLIENFYINPDKIKVIYNSYDIESIQKLSQEPLGEKYEKIFDKPVVIGVGRFTYQKGFQHLIRSFHKVKQKVPNAQLVLLGQGDTEHYLKKLAKDYNLNNDIHFLGFQKNPFKFISKSHLYVMPSLFEGFPNALAEAMACGVSIISADCFSGPREILAPSEFGIENIKYGVQADRYGVLVPVCDGKAYTAQNHLTPEEEFLSLNMIKLLDNSELRKDFSKKSLKRIQDFDINKIIIEWETLIYNN